MKFRALSILNTITSAYDVLNIIFIRAFPIIRTFPVKRSDGLNYIFNTKIDNLL